MNCYLRKLAWICLPILLVVGAQSPHAAEPPSPTPRPDTEAKFRQDYLAYELRIADAYDTHTADPPAVRAAAHDLIVTSRKFWLGTAAKEVTREAILAEAERLIQLGSNDPLVFLIAGAITPKDAKEETILAYLDRAAEAMEKSQYSARERAEFAMRNYAVRREVENHSHRRKRHFPEKGPVQKAIVEWLATEGKAKGDQRFLFSIVSEFEKQQLGYANDDEFADLISQTPGVDTWLSSMFQAQMFDRQGWSIADSIRNVSGESDKLLRQAADHYLKAWKHNPTFPEPAAKLISLARVGATPEKPRYWFEQAIKAQFDYQHAYVAYLTVVRPGFQGSIEELYQFGVECAATRRFDTIVPMELMEALCAIDSVTNCSDDIWRRAGVFDQVAKMLDGCATSPIYNGKVQTDDTRSWFYATRIAAAFRAHRDADTAPFWDRASPADLKRAFSIYQVHTNPALARAKAEAMAAGFSLDIDDAATQISDAAAARKLQQRFEREAAKLPAEIHRVFIDYWRNALRQFVDYYADQWVDVTFTQQLPSLAGHDDWEVIDPHTIESRSSAPLPLEWLGLLKTPIQITCDIEAKEFPTDAQIGGILLGYDERRWYRPCGRLFGIDPLNDKSGYMSVGINAPARGGDEGLQTINHVEVQAWPGYSELFVNGERVSASFDRPSGSVSHDFDPSGCVMLWTPAGKSAKVNMVYSNLKIRRLRLEPPARSWSASDAIAFYSNRIDHGEKAPYDYFDRASAEYAKGDYTAALADFQQTFALRPKMALARVKIGMCQARLGNYEQAASEYQATLAQTPDSAEALERLAWLQATCPDEKLRDGKAALKNAEQACKLNQYADGYRLTYLAALVELGRFKDANKQLKSLSQGRSFSKTEQATLELISKAIEQKQGYRDAPQSPQPMTEKSP